MNISELVKILEGRVVCGEQFLHREVQYGFASDLMSDVLTLDIDKLVLITGLNNLQTIRTAEMADIECVVFARNKRIHPPMIELAIEHQMVLVECRFSMFRTVAGLSAAGLKPVY